MEQTCEICKFYVVIPAALHTDQKSPAQCHKNPPMGGRGSIDDWPGVSKHAWCSKWKTKRKKQKNREMQGIEICPFL